MGNWVFNDLPGYIKHAYYDLKDNYDIGNTDENMEGYFNSSPYEDSSTTEYQAHSIIEPTLKDEFFNYSSDDMMGYNYNKFNMGGSLPGSVGFMYARTNSPAPSNGPYAKKTKASAQDGKTIHPIDLHLPKYEKPKPFFTGYGFSQNPVNNVNVYGVGAYGTGNINDRLNLSGNVNSASVFYPGGEKMFMNPRFEVGMKYKFDNGGSMSYYQNGLDWKPKSISKNGGWLENHVPQAQKGFELATGIKPVTFLNNATDIIGRTPIQIIKHNQKGEEIANRNIATNKRQFLNQGQATTKESEARRKTLTKQAVNQLPNVIYDEQTGTTSAVNPNMTYEGDPANFMGERQQKAIDHIAGALEAAGYITGAGELAGAGYSALRKGISTLPSPKTIALSKILDNSKLNTKLANNLYANRILEEELIAPNVSFKGLETNLPEGSRIINHAGSPFLQKDGRMYYIQEHDDRIRLLDNTDYFVPHPEDLYPSKSKLKDLKKYNISDKSDPIYDNQWYHFNQTTDPIDDWIIHNDLGGIKGEKTWWKKSEPYKGMTNRSLFDQPEGRHIYAKQSALESSLGRPLNEHRELIGDIIKKGNVQRGGLTITPTGESLLPNVQGLKSFTYNPLTKSMERGIFKKKQGGVVKDDNGYWNPDNWGKVVEIDSPDITMKGVDQDLIGISDEGDVQYMTRGKDYKFKGKKVREYPVGKNGVNQQDEKVYEQLDQLINFSNYNTSEKGGWLDKYLK
jgi:hypothetical protein